MRIIVIASLFALMLVNTCLAQAATHSVILNWIDSSNPSGTTYNVYRATGLCGGTPAFSKLASAVAVKTFSDSTVIPGNFCYQVTAVVAAVEGAPSNTINPQVQPFTVQLSFTQQ